MRRADGCVPIPTVAPETVAPPTKAPPPRARVRESHGARHPSRPGSQGRTGRRGRTSPRRLVLSQGSSRSRRSRRRWRRRAGAAAPQAGVHARGGGQRRARVQGRGAWPPPGQARISRAARRAPGREAPARIRAGGRGRRPQGQDARARWRARAADARTGPGRARLVVLMADAGDLGRTACASASVSAGPRQLRRGQLAGSVLAPVRGRLAVQSASAAPAAARSALRRDRAAGDRLGGRPPSCAPAWPARTGTGSTRSTTRTATIPSSRSTASRTGAPARSRACACASPTPPRPPPAPTAI